MADEINTTASTEVAAASAPKEKKTRGPRKAKTVTEAAPATSVSAPVKKTRGPRKAKEVAAPAAAVAEKKAAAGKVAAKAQPAKRGPRKVELKASATDGFADLLKLEEENQKLRKALSDKLRAENADLRKKLGVA
ncbi:hypothetical protein JNB88_10395 [Rhizobium cauense]|uniref:hypothetical protein n=1 Tax=Rhizobium cauense TaxID=1166683 RepID=UPI001C6F02CB|nr:hypothetical protein [Rhizobium cauense]MBW9114047.1 hypothetical protein [Rhizobium cauense]